MKKQSVPLEIADIMIGECSSEDMKNTMFNEAARRVIIYRAEDFSQFSELLELLMGEDVPQRRQYIFDNIDFHKLRGASN